MILNDKKFVPASGDLFFDFVNTVIVQGGEEVDLLETPLDFFAWTVSAGILKRSEAKRFASTSGDSNEAFFEEAKRFRNALRGLAFDLARGLPVSAAAVNEINRHLKTVYGFRELVVAGGTAEMRFKSDFSQKERLLAPVASDAAKLLTEGDTSLVKQCESENCVLFFYDSTKNHSRRWCSMGGCGNREKAKAYYQRKKVKGKK